jgi:hypothetical protein
MDADMRLSLAMYLAGLGRCDQAERQVGQGIAEQPDYPVLHYYAAVALAVCGQRRAAVDHAAQAVREGYEVDVRSNPDLQPLLSMPELAALLRRAT